MPSFAILPPRWTKIRQRRARGLVDQIVDHSTEVRVESERYRKPACWRVFWDVVTHYRSRTNPGPKRLTKKWWRASRFARSAVKPKIRNTCPPSATKVRNSHSIASTSPISVKHCTQGRLNMPFIIRNTRHNEVALGK